MQKRRTFDLLTKSASESHLPLVRFGPPPTYSSLSDIYSQQTSWATDPTHANPNISIIIDWDGILKAFQ